MLDYEEIKDAAERARFRLSSYDTPDMRDQIVDTALAMGYDLKGTSFYSRYCDLWVEVFRGNQDMQDLLKESLK